MTTNRPVSSKKRNKNLGLDVVLEFPRVQEATTSQWHRKITVIIQPDVFKANKTPCEQEEEELMQGCLGTDVIFLQISLSCLRQQDSHRFWLACWVKGIKTREKRQSWGLTTSEQDCVLTLLCILKTMLDEILWHSCFHESFWILSKVPNSTFNNFPCLLESCKISILFYDRL